VPGFIFWHKENAMLRRLIIWILQCLGFDPRGIFSFWDGKRWRHADPFVVARKLWAVEIPDNAIPNIKGPLVPFESESSRRLIQSGIGSQIERGYSEVSSAVRAAFGVVPLREGGLTEAECDDLLQRFENYMGDVKKNGSGSPTSPLSTDSTEKSTTNSGSAAGSTSTDQAFVLPDVSGMELTSGEIFHSTNA